MNVRVAVLLAVAALPASNALAQSAVEPLKNLPDPYEAPIPHWGNFADGHPWGSSAGIERGPHGEIWAIDRCGANSCDGSVMRPSFSSIWPPASPSRASARDCSCFRTACMSTATAISGSPTREQQGRQQRPAGREARTGRPGADAAWHRGRRGRRSRSLPVALRRDHRAQWRYLRHRRPLGPARGRGARLHHADHEALDGRQIHQAWGKPGKGQGEFNSPHALAMDSQGRLFVADRGNSRIQIFDQDGKFIAQWTQFGRPVGFLHRRDRQLYAIDADSSPMTYMRAGRRAFGSAARRTARFARSCRATRRTTGTAPPAKAS